MGSNLRSLLLLIVACAPVSNVFGEQQEFRILPVDLDGNPVNVSVELFVGNEKVPLFQTQSDNGIAIKQADIPKEEGYVWLNKDVGNTKYLKRREKFTLAELGRFPQGFAIPVWGKGDVPRFSDVWIKNPSHIAVAVQRPQSPGDRSRIIVKLDQDVDEWVSRWAPDLPQVVYPPLARALDTELEPGDAVPPKFDAALQLVWDEVDRQNDLVRVCRLQGPNQNPPDPPPNTPPPPDNPPPGVPPGVRPPPPPLPPQPLIGKVMIHNAGPCDFVVAVNNQLVFVRRESITSVDAYVGPVTTTLAGRTDSYRIWNHWVGFNGVYSLTLFANSQIRYTPRPYPDQTVAARRIAPRISNQYAYRPTYTAEQPPQVTQCYIDLSPYPRPPIRIYTPGEAIGNVVRALFSGAVESGQMYAPVGDLPH